jgi:hypothetical protein
MATVAQRSMVDEMLDEILPEQLDWERLVRSYPVPALLAAAAGGFVLAYTRGPGIITALSALATSQIADAVKDAATAERIF